MEYDIREEMWKRKEKELWAEAGRLACEGLWLESIFIWKYQEAKREIFGDLWQ